MLLKNMIQAKNITKKYGEKTALNNFSININTGYIHGLIGPNGSGKTTFLRILNQIIHADSGQILIDNIPLNISHISTIGYMPEERGLYRNMKVEEQLIYLSQLKGLSKKEAKENISYWFNKLSIENWANKKLSELSKGMAQKIQFIATVIHKPKILILDEPFSGFDPVNANVIRDQILELKQNGTTILFSSHRMESVEDLCDSITLLYNSNKILEGSISDIKKQYTKPIQEIAIENISTEQISDIHNKFNIISSSSKEGITTLLLQKEKDNNSIINTLSQYGNILSFSEDTPTLNDIFLQAIKGSNASNSIL